MYVIYCWQFSPATTDSVKLFVEDAIIIADGILYVYIIIIILIFKEKSERT